MEDFGKKTRCSNHRARLNVRATRPSCTIVHIGKYYPPDPGGIERITKSLGTASAAEGIRTVAVCFTNAKRASLEIDDGVNVLRLPPELVAISQPLGWRYFISAVREG